MLLDTCTTLAGSKRESQQQLKVTDREHAGRATRPYWLHTYPRLVMTTSCPAFQTQIMVLVDESDGNLQTVGPLPLAWDRSFDYTNAWHIKVGVSGLCVHKGYRKWFARWCGRVRGTVGLALLQNAVLFHMV